MQSLLKGCREKNILSNDCLKIHISSKDNVKCKFHLKICEKTRICSKFYGKICDIHQRIGNKKKLKNQRIVKTIQILSKDLLKFLLKDCVKSVLH